MRAFICIICQNYIGHGLGVFDPTSEKDPDNRSCWICWNKMVDEENEYQKNAN